MIPQIFHLTTKTGNLSNDEARILARNKKIFPDWDFKLYGDDDNLSIIKNHFPEFLDSYNSIKKGVMKADIIRCLYLYLWGGVYIDTDYQFFKKIPQTLMTSKCVIPAEQFNPNGEPYLGNCIFFSEPSVAFWYDYVKNIFEKMDIANTEENGIIDCTGPGGITRFYLENKNKYDFIIVPEKAMFHPLIVNHHLGVKKEANTIGAHYCFGSWRGKTKSNFMKHIYKTIQHIQSLGWNVWNF